VCNGVKMKRVLLVVSHVGSNSSSFCRLLDKNKRIQYVEQNLVYDNLTSIEYITSREHKSTIGIYLNDLVYNYQISNKNICKFCDFIYLIRDPKTFNVENPDYYIFRLRRIYELAREFGGVFLTWGDVASNKAVKFVENRFGLASKLNFEEIKENKSLKNKDLRKLEVAYELCYYRLAKLNLDRPMSGNGMF
jgi:hypothetical protein